ncbi:4-hydroxy-3-methylbut-2-enyl diphosphate reductase [subsurface metagenome]
MKIEIDQQSGFCFGVEKVIKIAEDILKEEGKVYCLGEIVHNQREMERLVSLGLVIIDYETYRNMKNCKVLIRAHGEPPETYEIAKTNNIQLLDGTCPIVDRLQKKVKIGYEEMEKKDGQVVIFGKEKHAEVVGLKGQTEGKAIVISHLDEIDQIDFSKPVVLYSQTTRNKKKYRELGRDIQKKINGVTDRSELLIYNTICNQVTNRELTIREFARNHDLVLFVSGKNSSNGKMLYQVCKEENPNSRFISAESEIKKKWFDDIKSVGICGATSTPEWLMRNVAEKVKSLSEK